VGQDWCLCHTSKSIFGLMWPWTLTSWPPKLIVAWSCPTDHLCQFTSKSVHSLSKYHIHNIDWTNGWTDKWTSREYNASTCRSGVTETLQMTIVIIIVVRVAIKSPLNSERYQEDVSQREIQLDREMSSKLQTSKFVYWIGVVLAKINAHTHSCVLTL